MNIATMSSWFDILQDKYGSAYYTDSEKSLFLNRAQIEFVNEFLPKGPKENQINIELSQDTISQISPLIYELPSMAMNSSGIITKAAIATALDNLSSGALVWRPLSIGWEYSGTKKPVTYMRHNDRWKFEDNFFKKPSLKSPKVRETSTTYVFGPISTTPRIYFTILKYPQEVDITTDVDSDLPDFTHNKIVAMALEFAGVGSRDILLSQLLQEQEAQKIQ